MTAPALVIQYCNASKDIFGVKPFIHASQHKNFQQFERKLAEDGIFPKEYAYNLLNYLKDWCKKKQFKFMPVNIFIGNWAYTLYKEKLYVTTASPTTVATDVAMLVQEEYRCILLAATTGCGIEQAIKDISIMQSEDWVKAQKRKTYMQPIRQAALQQLNAVLCTNYASYNDI